MRTLYLHIGSFGVGTKHLQKVVSDKCDGQLKNDVVVVNLDRNPDDYFEFSVFAESGVGLKYNGKIAAELTDHGKDVILSSDYLSYVIEEKEIEKLYNFLSEFFDRIFVVSYLVRQDLQYLLLLNRPEFKFIDANVSKENKGLASKKDILSLILDYHYKLINWTRFFGENNVLVRIAIPNALRYKNPASDFLSFVEEKKNTSGFIKSSEQRGYVTLKVDEKICDTLSNVFAVEYVSKFIESNKELSRRFFDCENVFGNIDHAKKRIINDNQKEIELLEQESAAINNKLNQLHESFVRYIISSDKKITDVPSQIAPYEIINKNSSKTLVVFSGMATRPSMPVKEFFSTLDKFDVNVLYLKDFKQSWYLDGLLGVTSSDEETIDWIYDNIPKATKNIIFMGTSAGGYAALRLGMKSNANKVIAFSPQTYLDQSTYNMFKQKSTLIYDELKKRDVDIRNLKNNTKIDVHFGKGNLVDLKAALYISDLSNVSLYEYSFDGHNIGGYLKKNSLLEGVLKDALSG